MTVISALCLPPALAVTATFTLLTNDDAKGYAPTTNWVMTPGENPLAGANPNGAFSFNFVDPSGSSAASDPAFTMAPALTGTLTLQFAQAGVDLWDVSVSGLSYAGLSGAMAMNQYLDAGVNEGSWSASSSGNWTVSYGLNFYLETNLGMGPMQAHFYDTAQVGYLIPVSKLTPLGLSEFTLADPTGFYTGDFADYVLDEIASRLPGDAEYLLISQMAKSHPDSTSPGLPITTNSWAGNTTFAYTTSAIPEPSSMVLFALGAGLSGLYVFRRNRGGAKKS